MNYKINRNTLLHSVSFNPFHLEQILIYGILSKNDLEDKKRKSHHA